MVSGFTKSELGLKEYAKIGAEYPPEFMDDTLYEKWVGESTTDGMEKYTGHKPVEVQSIHRRRLADGTEWLTYATKEYRLDKALNVKGWSRSNLGKHPRPIGFYEITTGDFGKQVRKLKYIEKFETIYEIPFSKKNIDKIMAIGTPLEGAIQFYLVAENGLRFHIDSFDSLRNTDFDVLRHFGRTPTSKQLKDWKEKEGYIEDDNQRMQQVLDRKNNRGTVERPITTSEVQEMMNKQQQQQQQQQQQEQPPQA